MNLSLIFVSLSTFGQNSFLVTPPLSREITLPKLYQSAYTDVVVTCNGSSNIPTNVPIQAIQNGSTPPYYRYFFLNKNFLLPGESTTIRFPFSNGTNDAYHETYKFLIGNQEIYISVTRGTSDEWAPTCYANKPSNFQISNINPTSFHVTYDNTGANFYKVAYRDINSTSRWSSFSDFECCGGDVYGLKPGTTYNVTLSAECGTNYMQGVYMDPPIYVTITTPCLTTPYAAPTNVNMVPTFGQTGNGYTVFFNPVEHANSYLIEYIDLVNNQSGSTTVYYSPDTNPGNFFNSVPVDHNFKFRIKALSYCTNSLFSDWINVAPLNCYIYPTNLNVFSQCGSSMPGSQCGGIFTWSPVSGAQSYQIEYTIFNLLGQTITGSATSNTASISAPAYASSSGAPWRIKFKVKSKCVYGVWSEFSPWSANFAW